MQKRASSRTTAVVLAVYLSFFAFSQSMLQVGYTVVTANTGSRIPGGSVLFSYTNSDGVLVSETGVGAAERILSGRIFVDQTRTETGIALVNPSEHSSSVKFVLRDASGREVDRKTESLDAGRHLSRYLSQLFGSIPSGFTGSLTFESDQKIAAITLRESRNVQGEPLYTTLPVVDLSLPASTESIVFPQIAAGEGYSTQLILINTTSQILRGRIRLASSDGNPLQLRLDGVISSEFSYQIEPNGTYRAELDNPSGLGAGFAVVTPDPGTTSPFGSAIFQFKREGIVVTEAGVSASPSTTLARIFVDNVRTYTGVAVANPSDRSVVVTFVLLDRYGASESSTTRTLAPQGHLAVFAHQLFPELHTSFTGLIEVSSSSPVSPVTLKLTDNARGDQVLTTLPVADLTRPPTATSVIFPQIAIGEGFASRLILINTDPSKPASIRLNFYESSGSSMTVPLGGRTGSEFSYEIAAGGGRQFLPGNTAKIAGISILDPTSNLVTKEIVVNEGKSVRPTLLVVDTSGLARDDFDLSFSSLSSDTASLDSSGSIQGKKAGFSTLTVSSGGVLATATITVVGVNSGATGFAITGVAQDLARRLYLANTNEHTILIAQDLTKTPAIHAGVAKTAGLKNDSRLQSWFKNPSYLAFHQATGSLYVSDKANHVMRTVQPGPTGRVETVAGTGLAGSKDGPVKDASFNEPQGVALDNRGNLWVVDSGNHTIRRINLATAMVETIAGKAGRSGRVDGKGEDARFSSPTGIALEPESVAQQLERERKGGPPPPVRLIVADTGNGVIRRVKENGEVETLRSSELSGTMFDRRGGPSSLPASPTPVGFASPTAVAVDPFGNIYVTESSTARVKCLLQTGEVVSAVQAKTFSVPAGIVVTEGGRVVVSDSGSTAREISYGEPQITTITPDTVSNKGGEKITVKGNNFAPDTLVLVGGVLISATEIKDTRTILFTAPALPSGRTTITVQNRGGLAQTPFLVDAVPLSQLQTAYITTVAGGGTFVGDGAAANSALISTARGIAVDSAGNIFIADRDNHRIRRVAAATGTITTVAGTGGFGFSGDNTPATAATLFSPNGVALDAASNLFIADSDNQRIRKVDARTGIISTVAGNGTIGFSGDEGLATVAALGFAPAGVAVDAAGNLFIADGGNHRIRKVDNRGIITTIAGNGRASFSGDGGPARDASLNAPGALALDAAQNALYIADVGNDRIRLMDAGGNIRTLAGNGQHGSSGDNGLATSAALANPNAIALDAGGNLLISDSANGTIRRVDTATKIITTVAGGGAPADGIGDNGPATSAALNDPGGVAVDAAGNLFISDARNYRVRKVGAATRIITTIAGVGLWNSDVLGDGRKATAAILAAGGGVAVAAGGDLFIADSGNGRIRRVALGTRIITTVAGNGQWGFSGDGGAATAASLAEPSGVAVDAAGNLLVADTINNRIRKVDAATGIISTVAGGGSSSSDDVPALEASLNLPGGVAVDREGNIYLADTINHKIRKVDVSGRITTLAGNGREGFSGDNGPATAASLSQPFGVAVDVAGNVFIADSGNGRIRKVSATTKIITTVAGSGCCVNDNEAATTAGLSDPRGLAMDVAGNFYIAVRGQSRVRKVNTATGVITTVAGDGTYGFAGDNGPAASAQLGQPSGIAFDSAGNLFIADGGRIRAVRGPIP